MRSACILSGSSHPQLTKDICKLLSTPVGKSTLNKFSNKETNVMIDETVRGVDCYIVQSPKENVNDQFMEMLIMISACKTASAASITAVIPCFPYARQSESLYRKEPSITKEEQLRMSMKKNIVPSDDSAPLKGHRPRLSSISFSTTTHNIHDLLPPSVPESATSTGYKHWYKYLS